ncbi:hypothetical protein LMB33_05225 [Limosilactobacillus reuteri]|nr:hypothetical protein [Limosilactobacillus reuteri]
MLGRYERRIKHNNQIAYPQYIANGIDLRYPLFAFLPFILVVKQPI